MNNDELKDLVVKLALIAQRLDERSEAAVQRVEQTGVALDRRAHGLSNNAEDFAQSVLRMLRQMAGEALGSGIDQAAKQCNKELTSAAQGAAASVQEMQRTHGQLQRERRTWVWIGSGALLIGSVLAVGASAWMVKSSREQVARHQIEARLLRAYNQADVTLCGEQLCANIDPDAPGVGAKKQYRLVQPRKEGPSDAEKS